MDLLEAIDVALAMAAATEGLVDPTVGLAMIRLGYDRDFADVRRRGRRRPPAGAGRAGLALRRGRPALPHACASPRTRRSTWARPPRPWPRTGLPRPFPTQLGCGALVSLGGDVADRGPRSRRRIRRGHRRHLHRSAADRGREHLLGRVGASGVGVRHWRLGAHQVHHILDPATGLSADPCWRTVSVTAASCVQANAASTAAIVLAERAVDWLEGLGLPARLVRLDGTCGPRRGGRLPRRSTPFRVCRQPDAGVPRGDRRPRLRGPVVPDAGHRPGVADPPVGHRRPRDGGLGGVDHEPLATLPVPVRPPEPVALLPGADRGSTSSRPSATATSPSAWPTR